MTQRMKGITVALENDVREDDLEYVLNAIRMIKGVSNAIPIPNDPKDFIVKSRIKNEIQSEILKILSDV